MDNDDLRQARQAKNDEFYTQYADIEKEVNAYLERDPDVFRGKTVLLPCDDPDWSNFTKYFAQNFERLGLKKLASTSYATPPEPANSLPSRGTLTVGEPQTPQTRGKVFTLTRDTSGDGRTDLDDFAFDYLNGDGDFRSSEVKALRDEADIVVTNPPFSLFREFLAWVVEAGKQFLLIGNLNAITYKEVFPLVQQDRMWLGATIHSGDREFRVPDSYPLAAAGWRVDNEGNKYIRVKGVRWFTNLDHGRRHEPLALMSMADNLKFSRHAKVRERGYPRYDNYDAIEVPYTDAIPSDYRGVMGVPISFLDKYSPEQFHILGITDRGNTSGLRTRKYAREDSPKYSDLNARSVIVTATGEYRQVYARILIERRTPK